MTTMTNAQLLPAAAAPLLDTLRAVALDQLSAPTPCADYDVRALVQHLSFWGPSLEAAGRKEVVAPPAGSEDGDDLTRGWPEALQAQVERTAEAWGDARAWEGATSIGGPDLPASLIGGMVVGELVVHGWDLARATGRRPDWDEQVLAFLLREVEATAEQGRELGIYGPEVPVAPSAPTLERILGLTGRDPAWTP